MAGIRQRQTLKLLHIAGTVGYCAALLALMVLHASLPDPTEVREFASVRLVMGNVAKWLLLPSTGLVVVSGLFAMALNTVYQSAGWVWAKLATGVLVMEGTLVYVQAPMERAAIEANAALAGDFDLATLGATLGPEWGSLWVILAVAAVNVVLGVYRPRFSRRVQRSTADKASGSRAEQANSGP